MDELQNDVQIVNHQIQNDIHIRAPFKERMQAVHFDEDRTGNDLFQRHDGRIEAFHKTDLENEAVFFCQRNQVVRFFEGRAEGLFDQHICACRKEISGNRVVGACGNGNAHGINPAKHFPVVCESPA